jgi:pyruvate/2-oxoglutarate dehydrogenase complex dihydrolipoamide acyltransferase (E2) component
MKFNQRVTLEYDKERCETTDRENDIRTNIEAMGKQLIQLAKNIKDNGELLRKYELSHFDITNIFRVDGMSSISQADIIEHGVKAMLGVKSIQVRRLMIIKKSYFIYSEFLFRYH